MRPLAAALWLLSAPALADSWTMTITCDPNATPQLPCVVELQVNPTSGLGYSSFSAQDATSLGAQRKVLMDAKAFFKRSMATMDAIALEHLDGVLP